jgi:hypothetical protein
MTEREKLVDLLTDVLGDSIARKADYLISNGVTVQKWIPVTERLPENDVDVLALLHTGDSVVVERCGETWKVRWDGTNLDRKPTHWMPLPEPPKEVAG